MLSFGLLGFFFFTILAPQDEYFLLLKGRNLCKQYLHNKTTTQPKGIINNTGGETKKAIFIYESVNNCMFVLDSVSFGV